LKFIFSLLFFFTYTLVCFADELIIEPDRGREPILTAILNATSSIDLAMYGLTDSPFTQALVASKNNGKKIRVLLEPYPYKSLQENKQAIKFLQQAHIPLQFPSHQFNLLHQKTFLFDQRTALIMTFNLTHAAFSQAHHRERNFALLITEPSIIQEIQTVFNADWQHQAVTVAHPHLVWSPDNSRKKIVDFIHQAKTDIKIYTENITDYQIIGALANAARSHINVQILMSSKPNKKSLKYLTRAGVVIHISPYTLIHAKVIMIDHARAILGSINLTEPSLDKNRELSVITDNKSIVQLLVSTFTHDWLFYLSRSSPS
jgi:phosphatidylserine/phosphatidylglycerophosphate/cardiolipin synthase-like enzyme